MKFKPGDIAYSKFVPQEGLQRIVMYVTPHLYGHLLISSNVTDYPYLTNNIQEEGHRTFDKAFDVEKL